MNNRKGYTVFYPPVFFSMPLGGIVLSYQQSSAAGKGIVLILIVFSIFAWTVMISKFAELYRGEKESKRFLSAYRAEAHPVALFLKQRPFAMTPLYLVYDRACQALGGELNSPQDSRSELFNYRDDPQENRITPTQLEIVRNLIERNVADQALLLEDHMGFLATSVSVAPFLGLLGTVWGVMDAFGGMAIT
ncbi:MAG: MotA/TolQ/ExbB proton channel family protein, partial [Kiritimatiellae bacterium]|nr:MotA/TolQ/ExbB proton channel family protein [Kiritimatiellia bacterium]